MMRCRILAALLLLAGTLTACSDDDEPKSVASPSPPVAGSASAGNSAPPAQGGVLAAGPDAAAAVVQQVRGAVVLIRTGAVLRSSPFEGGSAEGTGSGFVVDPRGYIVTNNHVVTDSTDTPASRIQVILTDGRALDAGLIGRDARTDLAVLKVDAENLTALRWADFAQITEGQAAVAIGFPLDLGLTPTVTVGVVSAMDRVINSTLTINGRPYRIEISGAIQTDTAINPGNSGGPLLNMRGEVLGVNTAGLTSVNGQPVQGIFFAVGSQVAQPIVQSLIERGNVQRGYLGAQTVTVTRALAQANNLGVDAGAAIVSQDPTAAAALAGLRLGDVVVRIGDQPVANSGDLTRAVTRYQPGETVPVEVVRSGQHQTVQVTLGEAPTSAS